MFRARITTFVVLMQILMMEFLISERHRFQNDLNLHGSGLLWVFCLSVCVFLKSGQSDEMCFSIIYGSDFGHAESQIKPHTFSQSYISS